MSKSERRRRKRKSRSRKRRRRRSKRRRGRRSKRTRGRRSKSKLVFTVVQKKSEICHLPPIFFWRYAYSRKKFGDMTSRKIKSEMCNSPAVLRLLLQEKVDGLADSMRD